MDFSLKLRAATALSLQKELHEANGEDGLDGSLSGIETWSPN
jgi:hypothetical protein